jgi:hypothetical protein
MTEELSEPSVIIQSPSPSDPPEVTVQRSPDYRLVYSNGIGIFKTAWDFRFDFGTLLGGDLIGDKRLPLVHQQEMSVIMSPQHAKAFVLIAIRELKAWEEKFGEIKLSEKILEQFNLPDVEVQLREQPQELETQTLPTTYRQRIGHDTWHCCTNCSNWPTKAESKEQSSKPRTGELCNECKVKRAANNCR